MVYDRRFGDRVLHFEASGALLDASLVMRDRETDSWWSIMTSTAIGGAMAGAELVELPVGEKVTWRDWVARHPRTLVLSVDGREHVEDNPYDRYLASEETFRGLKVRDRRLPPKEPVFSFWWNGRALTAAHRAFEGGRLFRLDDLGRQRLLLFRETGAPVLASSRAFLVREPLIAEHGADPLALLRAAAEGRAGIEPLPGIDTFWYSWVAVHEKTELLE